MIEEDIETEKKAAGRQTGEAKMAQNLLTVDRMS
jgi:hypothetical protein